MDVLTKASMEDERQSLSTSGCEGCALAASAKFLMTVNTAPGHFGRKQYQTVSIIEAGRVPQPSRLGRSVKKLLRR
jgi:hypothetical protein